MMERNGAREMEERRYIRDTGRTLKKYGSTAKHTIRAENLIKHTISPTDTLQGLALKYGVTTEQIRRVNRLWASDSLFLREHLFIPVSIDSPVSSSTTTMMDHEPSQHISSPSLCSNEEGTANDFLAKLDSSIANVKKEVQRAQGSSEFCTDKEESHVQRRKGGPKYRNSLPVTSNAYVITSSIEIQRPCSSGEIHNFPTAAVMTQGKKVKTSLQRLQQEQDEMFQL